MNNFSTPMMKQYEKIKSAYKDCLVLYRMGDFYELFMEDAYIGARVLNITLTHKRGGKDGKIPMAGVPYHAVDSYLAKLVKAGYKVAICEQVSLPNKYGLVDREVVRIVSPGTILDEHALDKKENNYIISVSIRGQVFGISIADLSTGYFGTYEKEFDDIGELLKNELSKIAAVECILPESLYNDPEFLKTLKGERGLNIFPYTEWDTYADSSENFLKNHFNIATLTPFGIEENTVSLETSAALLGYLKYTQKSEISHIKKITHIRDDEYLVMDKSTMVNLELFSTIRDRDPNSSLLAILDQAITPMGGRLLKSWLRKPLVQKEKIEERFDSIEELLNTPTLRKDLDELLRQIPDIERILSRLSVNIGNARDLVSLKLSLQAVLSIKEKMSHCNTSLIKNLEKEISQELKNVITIIEKTILEEPAIDLKDGNLIKDGVSVELDTLRKIVGGSRDFLLELEKKERERTGIHSLKIKYNKVFGFYIEISRANLHLAPKTYMRKQTLVNGERFITEDLKHHEEIILTAEEKIKTLEYKLYLETLEKVLKYVELVQKAAQNIGVLDLLLCFAYLSEKNNYVRPKILYSGEMRITQGRHPVVEKSLSDTQFVPNDITLDNISQQLLLITGPNMAGKSVFIRQVAIIVLMAQMGCFVSAEKAHISLVDQIFVRSGASDVITSGLSTFMVEMVETAHILHHATKNSLIVMDEIGRGTSTYDGISIAWAVAEYLATHFKVAPKTLFATHYHELQALQEHYPNCIKNFHMAVADDHGTPVFLHTILPGGASHSFGVAVARLAGVPEEVIEKAEEILKNLEGRDIEKTIEMPRIEYQEPAMTNIADHLIHKELENLDISQMTPLQALNKLADLKEKSKLLASKSEKFLEAD